MDLQEIKEIIKREGGKIVVVEQDQPVLIVMSFEEWRKNASRQAPSKEPMGQTSSPKISGSPPQKQMPATHLAKEQAGGLTIDDLPI